MIWKRTWRTTIAFTALFAGLAAAFFSEPAFWALIGVSVLFSLWDIARSQVNRGSRKG